MTDRNWMFYCICVPILPIYTFLLLYLIESCISETRMDSFGWSIDVASDDSILVGGPGMFHGE